MSTALQHDRRRSAAASCSALLRKSDVGTLKMKKRGFCKNIDPSTDQFANCQCLADDQRRKRSTLKEAKEDMP